MYVANSGESTIRTPNLAVKHSYLGVVVAVLKQLMVLVVVGREGIGRETGYWDIMVEREGL